MVREKKAPDDKRDNETDVDGLWSKLVEEPEGSEKWADPGRIELGDDIEHGPGFETDGFD